MRWPLSAAGLALLLFTLGQAVAQQTPFASVSSIAELKRAVDGQAQHIVLKAHLDLSREQLAGGQTWIFSLQGVQSIRVRCFVLILSRDWLYNLTTVACQFGSRATPKTSLPNSPARRHFVTDALNEMFMFLFL